MELHFRPITPTQIYAISVWRYPPPYKIYNLEYPPSADDIAYWLDPAYCVHSIVNQAGLLVAFCSFGQDGQVPGGDYSDEALDIGLGVRPDLTGKGKGHLFAKAVCTFAYDLFSPQALRVTIASKNTRAQRVWSKAGFHSVEQFTAINTDMSFQVLRNNLVQQDLERF